MNASVLLTGPTGFVGRALICELLRYDYSLTGAVRRSNGALPASVRRVVVGDMDDQTDWADALAGVDVVVHLAARVHVMNDVDLEPLAAFRRTNVDSTLNLARQAARLGVRRFIFVSSIGVNGGESPSVPFSEDSPPRPHSDYAVSKYEAEQGVRRVCAETGMEFVIIRPPLVYGPGAPGNFGKLIRTVAKGLAAPLPLGAVENRRSMVYLGNLTDFIRACISNPGAANQLFVVADDQAISTPLLIQSLGKALGKAPRLIWFPVGLLGIAARLAGKENMFQQLCGSLEIDASKARNILGWTPPFSVFEGLRLSAEASSYEKNF